jgi:hypothetical protein
LTGTFLHEYRQRTPRGNRGQADSGGAEAVGLEGEERLLENGVVVRLESQVTKRKTDTEADTKITVRKLEAARRQLEAAIGFYFHGGDPSRSTRSG